MTYQNGHVLFERYRIESLIGQGAFGEVYLVTHLGLNVRRALKILRHDAPGVGSTEFADGQMRFQLEAHLGAQLNSPTAQPNLLQIHNFEKSDAVLALEMEYAPGGSLSELLERARQDGQPLPVEQALKIALEIATGLSVLHGRDIVHRDLKPSNILFDEKGCSKLADLGLAQIPGGPSLRSQLSNPLPHPGTPGYMSPEQENFGNYLTPASDIYALGVTLFEMLTSRAYRSLRPGTPASKFRPDLSPDLDALLGRMLLKSADERPWDGEEVISLLQSVLKSERDKNLQASQEQEAREKAEQEERERKEKIEQARLQAEQQQKAELEQARLYAEEEEKQQKAKAEQARLQNEHYPDVKAQPRRVTHPNVKEAIPKKKYIALGVAATLIFCVAFVFVGANLMFGNFGLGLGDPAQSDSGENPSVLFSNNSITPTIPVLYIDPARDKIRVAVVMPSSISDMSLSQSVYDSLIGIQSEMGGPEKFEFVYSENMFQVDVAAAAIRDYAAQGYDLVIAHGSQYGTSLQEIAPDFPNTTFAHGTTNLTFVNEGITNVYAYEAASNEGGYVNGVIAARLTKSKIVGIVAPIDVGDSKLYIEGFEKGVREADPSIRILKTFTGSFTDVSLARDAAYSHIAAGADVLIGTGQMSVGAIGAVSEQQYGNVLWIGTHTSQTQLAPNIIVANQIYDWKVVIREILDRMKEGRLGGEAFIITLENKGLYMEYNESFSRLGTVKDSAESTVQGIINGSINALP